jgi:hypothetical protein
MRPRASTARRSAGGERLDRRVAHRPPGEQREERRAEDHAQCEQRDGIHAVAVGQLDDDRLEGKRDRGHNDQRRADEARASIGHCGIGPEKKEDAARRPRVKSPGACGGPGVRTALSGSRAVVVGMPEG